MWQWLGLNKDLKSLAVETTANQVCILITADNQFQLGTLQWNFVGGLCCNLHQEYVLYHNDTTEGSSRVAFQALSSIGDLGFEVAS